MKTLHLAIIVISLLMFGSVLNASGALTTESKIQLLTGKPTYVPGEKIQIIGAFNPNDLIHIDLVNPFDGTENSTLLQSDNTGHFRTNYVVPYNAVNGTWKILATSGYNHASLDIQVISSNYEIKNENTTYLYGPNGSVITIQTESPLKQFHSGIKPEYVKCSQNLHLIIKAEDGSFACVTIETGKNLAMRGWATTFGTGISTNDYYTKCDTLYPQSDTGIAVLYMPVNSIGKVCVQYHNLNNTPTSIGMRIFDANDLTQNASNVTAWTYDSTLEANANKTIVYFIKTGTSAGFYGASLNCGGIPFAVGYDVNSKITASEFPWVGHVFNCGIITYESHMEGTAGIGVRYIPYSYAGLK